MLIRRLSGETGDFPVKPGDPSAPRSIRRLSGQSGDPPCASGEPPGESGEPSRSIRRLSGENQATLSVDKANPLRLSPLGLFAAIFLQLTLSSIRHMGLRDLP
jgi:hypothetical protein